MILNKIKKSRTWKISRSIFKISNISRLRKCQNFISSIKSLPLSDCESQTFKILFKSKFFNKEGKNNKILFFLKENTNTGINTTISSPFSTLTQVCSNYYEHETNNQNLINNNNAFKNNEITDPLLPQFSFLSLTGNSNFEINTPINIAQPIIENSENDLCYLHCSSSNVASPKFYTKNKMAQLKRIIEKDDDKFEAMRQRLKGEKL